MKVICKRNIYNDNIEAIFRTKKEASVQMNVTQQAIYNSIKLKGNCKNYKFTEDEIDDNKIIEWMNNDR